MGAFQEAEGGLGGFGKAMLAAGAVVAMVVAGAMVVTEQWAAKFQADLALIHTQAGDTTADLKKIAGALEVMATEVGFGPDELAKSLYHVESAGYRGAAALNMVKQASELAKVGGANLESTTQAVIAAISAFGDRGLTAASAIAILNATVGAGDMRMEALAVSMGTGILVAARNVGLSFKDVGAAMATLTDNATPPEEAATRLRMTFSMLGAPTHKAAEALKTIGLSSTDLAADMRKPNGLLLAVGDLKKHLEDTGMTAIQQNAVIARAFGGGRSSAAIETLLSEFDRFKDKYGAITKGAKGFQQAWEDTQKTTQFQTQQMEANIKDLGTIAGMALLPMTNQLLGFAMPTLKNFAVFMAGPGQSSIASFGDHAKAVGNTVLDMGKQFVNSKQFGEIMTAAVATFGPIFKDAKKAVQDFMTDHKAAFAAIWATTKQIMAEMGPLILAVLGAIKQFWHDHGQQIMAIVKAFFNVIVTVISTVMTIIKDIIKLVTDIIKGDWKAVWADVVQLLKDAIVGIFNILISLAVLAKRATDYINSEVVDLGKSLILGIISGILSMGGAFQKAITDVVKNGLNAAKNFLGIHSPSTVFAEEVGKPISQGIGKGITDAAGTAHGALNSLLGDMGGSGSTAGSLAGLGAGGGGGIIFDFRGSQMMSDRDMETLAQKLLPALGRLAVGSGVNFRV